MKENRYWKQYDHMMDEFDSYLLQFIRTTVSGTFLDKMEYHLGWRNISLQLVSSNSGKRIRPMLCLLTYLLFSSNYKKVFPAAAALEIIHNFSLIFDDIQDRDHIRRGRPSVWSMWGEDVAINVGSAMQTLVHRSINQMAQDICLESVIEISDYISVSMMRLSEGQQLDIEMGKSRNHVEMQQYLAMVQKKTATLFETATFLGAVCSQTNDDNIRICKEFGNNLGIAFQLFDDALGIWGKKEKGLDKCCSDLENRKKTYPIIFTYSKCNGMREKNLIENYYSKNTITDTHISDLHQLFLEKKALENTLEAGQDYLKLAFEMFEQLDGDEMTKQLIKSLVINIVNKQLGPINMAESLELI